MNHQLHCTMIKYSPETFEFSSRFQKTLVEIIKRNKNISDAVKEELIKDINSNDTRNGIVEVHKNQFLKEAFQISIYEWKQQNLELLKLWKDVATQNAAINNAPHEVADATVKALMEMFNPEK